MDYIDEIVNQAVSDFDEIKDAITDMGVDVPDGTDTKEYGALIRKISSGSSDCPITYVENLDASNPVYLRELDSGTYVLYGKFKPFNGSTGTMTFSTGMLVSVIKNAAITYVQIFYSKSNTIQYLEITDESYTRKDAKLIDMESKANLTNTIDENSDDNHYPSAKAVFDYGVLLAQESNKMYLAKEDSPIPIIESLDTDNIMSMRDITDGYYYLTGYFHPYPNSPSTIILDSVFTAVARRDAGSHLMTISPLNFKISCYEILVDDTAEDGFTFTTTRVNLLELPELVNKVGDIDTALDSIIAIQNGILGVSE